MSDKGSTLAILHIEDDVQVQGALARLLKRIINRPYELVAVGSGEDALQALQENPNFDLVISDWDLNSFVNGGDVFAWVREHQPELLGKFIFISSNKDAEDMCSMAGIPFLMKPAGAHDIRQTVHAVLEAQ